jgi:hypothetical protein
MALVAAAAALAGCGASAKDRVQSKVEQFIHATATKDYTTLCDQVLAPALLAHLSAAGLRCEQAMQIALRSVRDPQLAIGRITIDGSKAQAITLSAAAGETGSLDTINLVDTTNGWRVVSLGSPVTGGAAGGGAAGGGAGGKG